MKAKAKPIKGSARTKKFDRGGTVAALAGLGTLAYLLNKKKKGADGEYKPQGKFPMEAGDGTSGPGMDEYKPKVDDAAKQRALDQSKDPRANYMPEGADRKELYSDINAKRTDNAPAPVVQPKKRKPAPAPAPVVKKKPAGGGKKEAAPAAKDKTTAPASKPYPSKVLASEDRPSKPYPEKEAAANKAAANSSVGKFNRKARAQNLGASYNAQYKALQSAPEGPGKEALKKAVAKAKADYEAAVKGMRRGGAVKKYAAGGSVKASSMGSVRTAKPSMGSASKRGDGIAMRGKTRGKVM